MRSVNVHLTCNSDKICRIVVRDKGVGFTPDRLVTNTPGLGLAFHGQRIKALGGHMEVESRPGRGSCFTIFYPNPTAL